MLLLKDEADADTSEKDQPGTYVALIVGNIFKIGWKPYAWWWLFQFDDSAQAPMSHLPRPWSFIARCIPMMCNFLDTIALAIRPRAGTTGLHPYFDRFRTPLGHGLLYDPVAPPCGHTACRRCPGLWIVTRSVSRLSEACTGLDRVARLDKSPGLAQRVSETQGLH